MHPTAYTASLTLAAATACLVAPPLAPALAQIAGAPEAATLGTLFGIDLDKLFAWATAVIAAASLIANVTDTDADNKAIAWLSKLLNFFALNFRK